MATFRFVTGHHVIEPKSENVYISFVTFVDVYVYALQAICKRVSFLGTGVIKTTLHSV
jgi:hypothetical protein